MYRESKPMLSIDKQIEHLASKGVKFEKISKEDVRIYLNQNNNYFKLCSYRKNFPKHPYGEHIDEYINLDFDMLKDLAIIDMRLRYAFIHMALDIEHFSKVKLLREIEQAGEDGYQIVSDYIENLQSKDRENNTTTYNALINELSRNMYNPYCGGIIKKYNCEYPVWAFVEIISFGTLIRFYGFCANRFNNRGMKDDFYLLKDTKELRNAAAHSNCLIHNMGAKDSNKQLNYNIARAIPTNIISRATRDSKVSNERTRQIITLLYTHSSMVTSEGVRKHQKEALDEVIKRMYRNIGYYEGNDVILTNFEFFKNVVDIFYS